MALGRQKISIKYMTVRNATEDDRKKWDELVKDSFLQSWAWGEFQRELKVPFWRLVVEEDGAAKSVLLVVKREAPLKQSWLYVPRGNLLGKSNDRLIERVLELAREQGALFVRVDPVLIAEKNMVDKHWRKAEKEVQPQHTMVLNLQQSEEEMLGNMHQKTRYNIRLAKRKGVTVRFSLAEADMEKFIELAKEAEKRGVFRYHRREYYMAMLKVLGRAGMLEMAVAELKGEVLAVNLLISFAGVTTYAHGASSQKMKECMAPHLLQWESIRRARQKGDKVYDFYGVAPPAALRAMGGRPHSWAGITRFKEGFGGKRVSYVGAYDYVLRPLFYAIFNVVKRMKEVLR